MSERATTIELAGPSAEEISNISGSKRPGAAGHRFGPELTCIECGKTWDDHQIAPTVCTPNPEAVAAFAARLDEGR